MTRTAAPAGTFPESSRIAISIETLAADRRLVNHAAAAACHTSAPASEGTGQLSYEPRSGLGHLDLSRHAGEKPLTTHTAAHVETFREFFRKCVGISHERKSAVRTSGRPIWYCRRRLLAADENASGKRGGEGEEAVYGALR
jgi:hypothetical protein